MARALSFGETHFGAASLGDKRRTARLVRSADLILAHPGGTLPNKLGGNWANLHGLYRLMASPDVTHQAVIETHCRRTLEHARHEPVVLFLQDSTELDFTGLESLEDDLGQIGNGGGHGYICHNSLAVTPDRRVIGLASQLLHKRRKAVKGESPKAKRDHPERESLLWLKGNQAIGTAPAGALWVHIGDRGGDTFEHLEQQHRDGQHYVIRCARNRRLVGDDHVGGRPDSCVSDGLHA